MNIIVASLTVFQLVGASCSFLIDFILAIYGIVLLKKVAAPFCSSPVQKNITALIVFEFLSMVLSIVRVCLLAFEYKRNQRRETKSTIQSQLYSSMTWGCKAVAADLPKLIILILLTVNKSDACTNGKERNIDRYTTVYWSFFAVGVALGVFLLCSAAFVRIVIRDYEADDSDTQPKIIAQATRLKRRFSHRHDESGEVDRGVKRSQPIKNLMLRFASSPAHGTYNADTSSSSDNPDRINVQIVERDVKMDPTIVTDLNLDELSFAHQNKRRASFTETDLSTLPTSPP